MKNKKLKILILILIIILILFFDFNFIKKDKNPTENFDSLTIKISHSNGVFSPNLTLVENNKNEKSLATLEIDRLKYQSKITEETSVADFMEKLKNEGKINFQEKNYIGMGKFIESINGIKNGEKNWIYYVNGQKANIGISNYKINSGDVVLWKYENNY